MKSSFIAHINKRTGERQTVREHSENTANLCKEFAIPELKELMYFIGLLHDCGKWQDSFQKRIKEGKKIHVDHSTCGAIEAKKYYSNAMGLMAQYCIAGHHAGIPDGGIKNDTSNESTLYGRMKKDFEDYSTYKEELSIPDINMKDFLDLLMRDCGKDLAKIVDKFAFFTRYCFSCLVDADSIDTAEFCDTAVERKLQADFKECLEKVNCRLEEFVCQTDLQKARSFVQKQVFEKVNQDSEIYLMNMPTGSGKTLCSIKFALERAIQKEKKRIIYVIPYNSIIDQTAEEFEKMFEGCAELLRHQSTFIYEKDNQQDKANIGENSEDYREAAKYAAENYEAPIILTTAVQFFESIYSNKRRKLRKLHNMSDSIIIFDEAHLMPIEYLQPCLQSIAFITRYLNSEAVFLTATMPDYKHLIKTYAVENSQIFDLVEDKSQFGIFKKCSFEYLGKIEADELLMKTIDLPSCLIIVNKKKTARSLYKACPGKKYHLSTYMTYLDRKRIIDKIKEELQKIEEDYPDGKNVPVDRRITVISTSLIEAGVDLDMFAVFRELTGLDSILQAGGRCNREGKRSNAKTFVFEFLGAEKEKFPDIKSNITRGLIRKYKDIDSDECIEEYYKRGYFSDQETIQKHTLSVQCKDIYSIPFREYAEEFNLIKAKTVSLVIPQDEECKNILQDLECKGLEAIRRLQKYACSLYTYELEDLLRQHAVKEGAGGVYYLANMDYYDKNTGISFEGKDYFV